MSGAPLLRVAGLRVASEAGEQILRGLDLEVGEGEILALVGPSGCGKTTTGLALIGMLPEGLHLSGGCIHFQGADLVGGGAAAFARIRGRGIACLPQEPRASLHPGLRVGGQIADGLVRHGGLGSREAWREAERWIERVGLPDPLGVASAFPRSLSGGMAQRVALARALACGPRLLVADEPSSALDTVAQARILHLLASLVSELGLAVLLITHDLAVAAALAGRVAVLEAGRVIEQGPVPEVLSRPREPRTRALIEACRASALPQPGGSP